MNTAGLTALHQEAIAYVALGCTDQQVTDKLGGASLEELLADVYQIWQVNNPCEMVIEFADRLSPQERLTWETWAISLFGRLPALTNRQKRLLIALASRTTAQKGLARLARDLHTDQTTLETDMRELFKGVGHAIETRAGLTMFSYLVIHAAPPHAEGIEDLPFVALTRHDLNMLRFVARGLSNEALVEALDLASLAIANGQLRRLLEKFGAHGRSFLALVYIRRYQPLEERLIWQAEVTYDWPDTSRTPKQHGLLELRLTWEYCDATDAELGRRMDETTENTVKTNMKRLARRLQGWPRNRQSVVVAAELHRRP